MNLTSCKHKANRIAQSIYNSMDLGCFTSSAYTDKLVVFVVYCPFFAPTLCGCALIEVLSMLRFSKSASSFRVSKYEEVYRHLSICKNDCILFCVNHSVQEYLPTQLRCVQAIELHSSLFCCLLAVFTFLLWETFL